jgi:low temperature requirement protein LtrA
MRGRDPDQPHRASTPLELFFDLCFVVGVGAAAAVLHHALVDGHVVEGVVGFLVVFFAIWWPWVNFTWFASAYDTDDVAYRLLTFAQMAGLLVATAGIPSALDHFDFRIMIAGYVIMRLALVALWLRAASEDPAGRSTAIRFAIGVASIQVLWILRLAVDPPLAYVAFGVIAVGELLVPVWAERTERPTPWHAGHIAERYGLFTIIVLGECILAASTAIQAAVAEGGVSTSVLGVAVGGLLLVFTAWWAYFKHEAHLADRRESPKYAFVWGYGHFVVFAAAAALGAGLEVAADATHGAVALEPVAAALTVAIPMAVYLVAVATLHADEALRAGPVSIVMGIGLLLATALSASMIGLSVAVPLMGVVAAGLIAYGRIRDTGGAPAAVALAAGAGAGAGSGAGADGERIGP